MDKSWQNCKRIVCVRPDNIGDLIMTGPALRALKESFGCHITVLTSCAAAAVKPQMPEIDEVMTADLPWARHNETFSAIQCEELIAKLTAQHFDGAIIFSVYSQNTLPSALLAFLANIPLRLAYCRENPYDLLTHWFPDKEPYGFILHQVRRDLDLVKSIGATTTNDELQLCCPTSAVESMYSKLAAVVPDISTPWMLLHPGVSEAKRMYPVEHWISAVNLLQDLGMPLLVSGTQNERSLAETIVQETQGACASIAGLFTLQELLACIGKSRLLVTVNTATTHMAAAMKVPQIVLYATTNPQHTPWKSVAKLLYFSVPKGYESRNEVIQYVNRRWIGSERQMPSPAEVFSAAKQLLKNEINNTVLSGSLLG